MTMRHRFPILITAFGSLMLLPFGVSRRSAAAQLRDGKLHVQFGPMFDQTFELGEIEAVEKSRWPLWAGIGPRTNFRGAVGLVGGYRNIVAIRFKQPQEVRMFVISTTCETLYLSMEHPEAFIEAVEEHLTPAPAPEPVMAF